MVPWFPWLPRWGSLVPGHLSSVPGTGLIPWYLRVVPSYLGSVPGYLFWVSGNIILSFVT